MTTRIVTDERGVRYRCNRPSPTCDTECPKSFCCRPLPHVHDWPLPGQAPQCLGNHPDIFVNPGDHWLGRGLRNDWHIYEHHGVSGFRLGALRDQCHMTEAWLISRCDEEESQ